MSEQKYTSKEIDECKCAVIRAAFGIQALDERELLDRLENLYLDGLKAGYRYKAKEMYPRDIANALPELVFLPREEYDSLRADLAAKSELAESLNRLAGTLREENAGLREENERLKREHLRMRETLTLISRQNVVDRSIAGLMRRDARDTLAALTGREG